LLECVCSLTYSAHKTYGLYYFVVCGLHLCRSFPYYLINNAILGKKLLSIKCVLRFPLRLFPKHFSFYE